MFGCILDCLSPLFLIEILDLLEVFGRVYGHSWTPNLKRAHLFIHKQMVRQRFVNCTVVHLLCAYYSKHPKLWDEHLHYIQQEYNRAKHSSTQTSPFEACFGYLPKSPLDFIFGKDIAVDGQYDIDRAEKFIEQIRSIHQVVQE
jgi:hypothetical protein